MAKYHGILEGIHSVISSTKALIFTCDREEISLTQYLLNELLACTEDYPEYAEGKFNGMRKFIRFKRSSSPPGVVAALKGDSGRTILLASELPLISQLTHLDSTEIEFSGELPEIDQPFNEDRVTLWQEQAEALGWKLEVNSPRSYAEAENFEEGKNYFFAVSIEYLALQEDNQATTRCIRHIQSMTELFPDPLTNGR